MTIKKASPRDEPPISCPIQSDQPWSHIHRNKKNRFIRLCLYAEINIYDTIKVGYISPLLTMDCSAIAF